MARLRRLRRGYFGKEESGPDPRAASGISGGIGAFSFGGHRLPSLYRSVTLAKQG